MNGIMMGIHFIHLYKNNIPNFEDIRSSTYSLVNGIMMGMRFAHSHHNAIHPLRGGAARGL
jgi:hypothetical protein